MITLDSLLLDNWVFTGDDLFPMEKKIVNNNPFNNSEDTDLKLTINMQYGENIALVMPDGGLLNLNIATMEELHQFESKLVFYDAPF